MKTQVIGPESPFFGSGGGIHQIYANDAAPAGFESRRFPDGAILVFDLLEAKTKDGITVEGARQRLAVMVKDTKRFPESGDWGFERFVGDSRTERGFTEEHRAPCFECHTRRKEEDFVTCLSRIQNLPTTRVIDRPGFRVLLHEGVRTGRRARRRGGGPFPRTEATMISSQTERPMEDARPFEVECDWCGRPLAGQIRRAQVGKMVVVQEKHQDAGGRPCLGSGRSLGTWPLSVELRQTSEGFEIRIGGGRARVHANPASLVVSLRDLGVEAEDARRQVAAIEPGRPVLVQVHERRLVPRSRGERGD